MTPKTKMNSSIPLLGSSTNESSFHESHPESNEPEGKHSKMAFSKLARRSKYILVMCSLGDFFSGYSFSIMAPFYPREAEQKGMDPTTIGFIFSVFELAIFVTSPIIGNYLTKLGAKFVFLSGIFVAGISNILFGTLHMCPPNMPFICLSFATRLIQAVGFSAYVTASFAIVSSEFPNNVAMTFGILQTASGVGIMIGPAIGGALYEVGGFGLPFYITGSAVLLNGILVWKSLPDPSDVIPVKRKHSIFTLAMRPVISIPMLSICMGALGLTFLEPTLANHLEPFSLTTGVVSLFFVIPPLMNAITSPLWGFLTDTKNIHGPFLVMCHFLFGVSFLVLGPSPLLPFLPFELWIVTIGLVFVGCTFAGILIIAMKCLILGALETGFEDSLDTYGMVSGIFNSMYTLGGFFGPMLGGILSQKYGNSVGFTVTGLINIISCMILICPFFVIRCWWKRRKPDCYSPIPDYKDTMSKNYVVE